MSAPSELAQYASKAQGEMLSAYVVPRNHLAFVSNYRYLQHSHSRESRDASPSAFVNWATCSYFASTIACHRFRCQRDCDQMMMATFDNCGMKTYLALQRDRFGC